MKTRHKEYLCIFAVLATLAFVAMPGKSKGPSDLELMSKVVRLTNKGDRGSCSGEQVKAPSGESYILTAAHCLSLSENGTIEAISEDGERMTRRVIAEDTASDLALIEGFPKMEGMDIAKFNYRNQSIRTFTHGKALATYKTSGVLIEEKEVMVLVSTDATPEKCSGSKYKIVDAFFFQACVLTVREMATTAMIVPGSSGGMVVNSAGELVGVVSAGGDGMGWLVTLNDIRNFVGNY